MVALGSVALLLAAVADERVRLVRVPDGGIQPQAVVDSRGAIELLLFRGDPSRGELFVASSSDGAKSFGAPRPVNGETSRAVATGTVRSARLALGKDDSLHVAWMGADGAMPRAPGNATPLLVSRRAPDADAFEPPRNLITHAVGLDGGFDVAADGRGAVAVVWHAPAEAGAGEESRRVWLARSGDDGRTFGAETAIDPARHGACACCGMRSLWTRGSDPADERLWILYRCAFHQKNRDMHALVVHGAADPVRSLEVDPWPVNVCVMSTAALASTPRGPLLAAWETRGQVFLGHFPSANAATSSGARVAMEPRAAPGQGGDRKHPRLAVDSRGECLFCWTEGTAWERGGALAWQLYDGSGRPIEKGSGRVDGVPTWSFGEPVALKDDRFVILY